jgi:hypothetical protein
MNSNLLLIQVELHIKDQTHILEVHHHKHFNNRIIKMDQLLIQ